MLLTALLVVGFLAASFWLSFAQKKSNGTHPENRVWAWAGSDCLLCMGKNSYSCI